jgi:uncharacterized protein (TIGR02147 family)
MATKPSFVEFVTSDFNQRKDRNSRYSKRAYAKFLGVSIGALSEILTGKRKLTDHYIEKIGIKLGLGLDEVARYQRQERIKGHLDSTEEVNYSQVQVDTFGLIADWYVMALFHLIDKKGIDHDHKELANRLGLSVAEIDRGIKRLLRLNLIKVKGKKYTRTGEKFLTTLSDEHTTQAAKNFQVQMLEKSIAAIEEQSTAERDHSGVTLLVNAEDIVRAKEMIKRFRRKFGKTFAEDNLDG